MKDVLGAIGIFLVLATICFGCYSLIEENKACHARGGAYVKGLMGYECVAAR